MVRTLPRGQVLKIKLEIDTSPPPGFETEVRFLLNPIPFPVRVFALPDLFAGKMHVVLCRRWKGRVKGRDWYDLVWFAGRHPALHLSHLEARMVQSGDWPPEHRLTEEAFRTRLVETIHRGTGCRPASRRPPAPGRRPPSGAEAGISRPVGRRDLLIVGASQGKAFMRRQLRVMVTSSSDWRA